MNIKNLLKSFGVSLFLISTIPISCGNDPEMVSHDPLPPMTPPLQSVESPTPTIVAVSQARVPNQGGTFITISGSGFVKGATVSFTLYQGNSFSGENPLFESESELRVQIPKFPAGTIGDVTISITNPDGKTTSKNNLLKTFYSQVDFGRSTIQIPSSAMGVDSGPSALHQIQINGQPYVVIANSKDKSVTVRGWDPIRKTLRMAPNIAVDSSPGSLASADFNADGKLDLLIGSQSEKKAYLFLGDGMGGFAKAGGIDGDLKTNIDLPLVPKNIVVGDFNNDGGFDFAMTGGDGLRIFPGNLDATGVNKKGTFSIGSAVFLSDKTLSNLLVADLNHDGKLDVLTSTSDKAYVLLNPATNNLLDYQEQVFDASGIKSLAVGDFTGTQQESIVLSYQQMNRGDGILSFIVNSHSIPGVDVRYRVIDNLFPQELHNPIAVASGDINGDGMDDVAVVNAFRTPGSEDVSLLLSNGDGTFQVLAPNFQVGKAPQSILTCDLNQDGKIDILVSNQNDNSVTLLLNQSQ